MEVRGSLGGKVPPSKLRPAVVPPRVAAARVAALVEPCPGQLVLVHAPAGYGKTTALANSHQPDWLWYNLDWTDQCPRTLAMRLGAALGLEPLPGDLPADGEAAALELALRAPGRGPTITFDRYQRLGHAPQIGRFLAELLALLPGLSVRLATRTRPAMPLGRLRLEGRLVEVGASDIRLDRNEIDALLTSALGRPPTSAELDFADTVVGGWPAALQFWAAGLRAGGDLMAPVRPGEPLHDYLHEELFQSLDPGVLDHLRSDLGWLLEPGPVPDRATTPGRRMVADRLVRDRVGVLPSPDGWRLHPLVRSFLEMHTPHDHGGMWNSSQHTWLAGEPAVGGARPRIAVRALGELTVSIDGTGIGEAAWPAAARRLLELLLCVPGYRVTATQAARLLWPRHLHRSAINSFNVALYGLRRVLQPGLTAGAESAFVARMGHEYLLRVERMAFDVEEFSHLTSEPAKDLDDAGAGRLEAALRLYRGDFLPSSNEDFVRERRARLRQAMFDTVGRLAAWHASKARPRAALALYGQLLELDSHREDVWARVLELNLSVGDEHQALAALQRCEQALRASGTEPSGLIRDLRRRIRRDLAEPRF